jgi:hypothetical protein
VTEPSASCVVCQKPAEVGYLCDGHFTKLGAWLRDVEVEAALISPMKSMAVATGNRGAGLASHRAPARLDAIVANDPRRGDRAFADAWGRDGTLSILDCLGGWARLVREERDLTPPDGPATVVGERRTLSTHLEWIAAQPWVEEFYGELRSLRTQLKATNGTQDEKPYGRCYLPTPIGVCNGPIWLDMAAGHAHCARCKQTWDGPQLVHLQWEMDKAREEAARPRTADGRLMLTAAELASHKGMRLPAVRKRLSRLGVKAEHGSYYDPDVLSEPQHAVEAS